MTFNKNKRLVCLLALLLPLLIQCGKSDSGGDDIVLGGSSNNNNNNSQDARAAGNGVRGGELYDHFWLVTGTTIPDDVYSNHPFTTLRCKSCHGWDYRGAYGVYGDNYDPKPFAINRDLTQSRDKSESYLRSAILNTNIHADYTQYLSSDDIQDLVAFIKNNMIDTSLFFDFEPEFNEYRIQKGGDQLAGDAFIAQNCQVCHGGQTTEIKTDLGRYSLGSSMRLKWFETHHKVLYGAPGTNMRPIATSPKNLLDVLAAFCDFNKYPSLWVDEEDPDIIAELKEIEETACANYN